MNSTTPLEDVIRAKVGFNCFCGWTTADRKRKKITAAFNPSTLEIYNDSHLHAHHKAMAGSTSRETHFRYDLEPNTTRFP
jgi:hypothetical protein